MGWTLIEHQARESLIPAYDFHAMTIADPFTGCWHFMGNIGNDGYGKLSLRDVDGKRLTVSAHRVAMFIKHGAIPDGMVVDHKCHVDAIEAGTCKGGVSCMHRRCVNPDHLRFLTADENRKYRTFPKHVKKKNTETCQSGRHSWTEENIVSVPAQGVHNEIEIRRCYPCLREASNASQQARRLKANPGKRSKEYWDNAFCPKGHERTPENTANYSGKLRCRECKNELARVWQAKKRSGV